MYGSCTTVSIDANMYALMTCTICFFIHCRYFINHPAKTTTWDDPRLNLIPPPPYHIAVTQPTAYFEVSKTTHMTKTTGMKIWLCNLSLPENAET